VRAVKPVGDPQYRAEFPDNFSFIILQLAIRRVREFGGGLPVIPRDLRDKTPLIFLEGPEIVFADYSLGMLVMLDPADRKADIVKHCRRFEQKTLSGAEKVQGMRLVKDRQRQFFHLQRMLRGPGVRGQETADFVDLVRIERDRGPS
jgi:hypothetical protein